MKIYTSYFAKLRHIPDTIVPIAICRSTPSWWTGLNYKDLSPSYDILNEYKKLQDQTLYTARFNDEVVKYLDFNKIYKDLENLSECKDVVLLCYEKPTDFCHRHIIAKYFRQHGYDTEEFKIPKDTFTEEQIRILYE